MNPSVLRPKKRQRSDEVSLLLDLPFLPCQRLRYSPQARIVLRDNTMVRLTPSENALFQALLEQPGQLVLTRSLASQKHLSLQMVRQHLGTLRQKLWVCELDVECIYGKGYRLSSFTSEEV